MRVWTTATLLFTLLASTGLCQTNSTNGTDTPDILRQPCFGRPLCGESEFGCCFDGICTSGIIYVPSTTTIVVTTIVPKTTYACRAVVTPKCTPCGTGCCEVGISECVNGRCSLPQI